MTAKSLLPSSIFLPVPRLRVSVLPSTNPESPASSAPPPPPPPPPSSPLPTPSRSARPQGTSAAGRCGNAGCRRGAAVSNQRTGGGRHGLFLVLRLGAQGGEPRGKWRRVLVPRWWRQGGGGVVGRRRDDPRRWIAPLILESLSLFVAVVGIGRIRARLAVGSSWCIGGGQSS
jgi:hypothetical protein